VRDPWHITHNNHRVIVDLTEVDLSNANTDAFAKAVVLELSDDVNEVVLVGPSQSEAASFMEFYGVAITIGKLVNDAGKAFKIAH
jgi:ABC-type uncharacterized transport system involved in gliding motility auxiliary subunit